MVENEKHREYSSKEEGGNGRGEMVEGQPTLYLCNGSSIITGDR